jgi:hypothetical protein
VSAASAGAKRLHRQPEETLPDGAMIQEAPGVWLALRGDAALLWSPAGYIRASRGRKGVPMS